MTAIIIISIFSFAFIVSYLIWKYYFKDAINKMVKSQMEAELTELFSEPKIRDVLEHIDKIDSMPEIDLRDVLKIPHK